MKAAVRYAVNVERLASGDSRVDRFVRLAGELMFTILTDDHQSQTLDRFVVRVVRQDRHLVVLEHRFGHDFDGANRDADYIRGQLAVLTAEEFEAEYGLG
jgi:hypothetical protein